VKSLPLLAAHRSAGALVADAVPPVVLSFREVPDEYRAAQDDAALFDHSDRELVEVRGPDAASFLHRLLANGVRGLAPGQGNRNLLLSSKGKVLFDLELAVETERITLSVAPGRAAALVQALDTYHFSEKLALKDVSESHAPLSLCGPRAAEIVARVTGVAGELGEHHTELGSLQGSLQRSFPGSPTVRVTAMPVAGSPGFRVDGGPEALAPLWEALRAAGARPAGRIAYDSLRVEAGWAEPAVDVDENVYPQEARLERAFSLDKGCYIGQEVVAKIDTYGGLNKRLVALRVSHDEPVERGTRLFREDDGEWRDLGVVTSWAYSFALDTGLVLAYVKRRHQASGTSFRLGDPQAPRGEAVIVPLPARANAVPPTGEFEPARAT
jgi:folate-binding protein YgfZ